MSKYSLLGLGVLSLFLSACAETQVTILTIPPPPDSSQLRIFAQPVTEARGGVHFPVPHQEFAVVEIRRIGKILEETGVYKVISSDDIKAAIGAQELTRWQLERNGWDLTRKIGRALYADYALIVARSSAEKGGLFFEYGMINLSTGKRFAVKYTLWGSDRDSRETKQNVIKALYRELFKDAKEDLLATALRKSMRKAPGAEGSDGKKTVTHDMSEKESQPIVPQTEQKPPTSAPARAGESRVVDMERLIAEGEDAPSGNRIIVYDFEADDHLKPVALILSESLREELFKLKRFTLVNRENLLKFMEELKFQQLGLVDENQAVQLGKGMAASEVITGRFGMFGKNYIMQVKRTDVQSFKTKGMVSFKCLQGQEDTLLEQMPELAKKLSESP